MRHITFALFWSYIATTANAGCKNCYVSPICETTTLPTTTTVKTTTEAVKHPWGPFYEFVLYTTSAVKNATYHRGEYSERINSYLSSLSKALHGLGPKSMQATIKLIAKGFQKLSTQKDSIVDKLIQASYDFLIAMTLKKRAYFLAMNKLYTPIHSLKFEDYIYDLKQYLKGYTDSIGKLTRIVWEDVVFHEFYKQDDNHQFTIGSLFMSAYEEYLDIDNRFIIPEDVSDEESEETSSSE